MYEGEDSASHVRMQQSEVRRILKRNRSREGFLYEVATRSKTVNTLNFAWIVSADRVCAMHFDCGCLATVINSARPC